ncbi:MAG: haloacid dehalogenase [Cycloclasticus sp. symbiont of Bathymodiolus heckerae]|nr:MAG: haloacid dehalogenase [Cycloclasticus sp. symbiont of Bathymodiolus heckerae]
MRIYKKLIAMLAAGILVTGCATVETESWQNCAIGGALLGGAGGAFVEGATEVAVGTVAGGIVGGALCDKTVLDKAGVEPDTDNDGVVDSRDECPNSPEGAVVGKNGCTADSDGDGVADYKDQCPDSAPGAKVNALGCAKALVLDGVNFHTGSAELTESAKAILLPIAVAHHTHHADVSLVVSGHTDSVGSVAYNQSLSERRAASVRAFMITHGCDAAKLPTKGYGESKAVADNGTSAGRAKNRRVELNVK